jgi:ferredoxin-nitrite reductase
LNWIGVWTPLGRMSVAQMRVLADIARDCGDGDIRLTVWQNLLISGVADARVAEAEQRIAAAGLSTHVSNVRAGLVACTGNRGCKFASSDTKGHALDIAEHLDAHITVDQPVNIHLTGCHHSCAQHYVGDIGLLGTKVTVNADGDQVEGYHIYAGGGFGAQASIGSQVYADITARDVPRTVEGLLRAYMAHRAAPDESFHQFTNRLDVEELKRLAQETLA